MKKYDILFLYLQEHWLPHHDAQKILAKDFPKFNFLTSSSDMFRDPEDLAGIQEESLASSQEQLANTEQSRPCALRRNPPGQTRLTKQVDPTVTQD